MQKVLRSCSDLLNNVDKKRIMKRIKLTQGKYALVDDQDYDWLNQFIWYSRKNGNKFYASRVDRSIRKYKTIQMHRLIQNPPKGMVVDHINGDGLDNRRSNLRSCTISQNGFNSKSRPDSKSSYKCVYWYENIQKWGVRVRDGKTRRNIGHFETELEAGIIANITIRRYHGEFAVTTPH